MKKLNVGVVEVHKNETTEKFALARKRLEEDVNVYMNREIDALTPRRWRSFVKLLSLELYCDILANRINKLEEAYVKQGLSEYGDFALSRAFDLKNEIMPLIDVIVEYEKIGMSESLYYALVEILNNATPQLVTKNKFGVEYVSRGQAMLFQALRASYRSELYIDFYAIEDVILDVMYSLILDDADFLGIDVEEAMDGENLHGMVYDYEFIEDWVKSE